MTPFTLQFLQACAFGVATCLMLSFLIPQISTLTTIFTVNSIKSEGKSYAQIVHTIQATAPMENLVRKPGIS